MNVKINNKMPDGITFSFRFGDTTYLVLNRTKRGRKRNANDTIAVYSDSELIPVETMCDDAQTHNQLVPQFNF